MKYFIVGLFFASNLVMAGVSDEVFISGKIGKIFNDQEVEVKDSLGQTYMLPKNLFPKDFSFKQGKSFSLEVPSEKMPKIKLKK